MSKPTPPLQPIIKDRSLLSIDTSRTSPLPSPSPSTHFDTSTTKDQQPSYFSPITPSYTPISHGILLKNSILLSNNNNNNNNTATSLVDKNSINNPSFNLLPGSTTVLGGIGAALNRAQSPEERNTGGNTTSGSEFSNSETTTDSSTTSSSTTSSAFGSPILKPTRAQSPSDSLATLTLASSEPNSPGASTILNNTGSITPGGTTGGVKHCTFAPLPKVDPIARRNSVALGVAARAKVLNSLDTDPTIPFVLNDAATPHSSTSITTPSTSSINNSITSIQAQPSPNRSRSHSPSPTSSRRSSGAALHTRPTGTLSPPLSSQELNVAGLAGILNSGIGHGFPLSSTSNSTSHGGIERNGNNTRSGSTSPTLSRRNSIETGLSLHYIPVSVGGSRSTSANMSGSGFLNNPNTSSYTSALNTSSDRKGKERESSKEREREVLGFDPIRAKEGVVWREEHGGYVGNVTGGVGVQKDHIGRGTGGEEEKEILAHVDSKGSKLVIELPPHVGSEDEGNDEEEVDDDEDEDDEEEEEDDNEEEEEDDEEEGERDQEGNEDDEDEDEEEEVEGEEERKTTGGGAIEVVRWRSESRQAS